MVCRCFTKRLCKRCVLAIVIIVALIITFKKFNNRLDDDEEWYKHPFVHFKAVTCAHDDYTMKMFEELTKRLVQALDKLQVTYFLCYGSLWGALKFATVLPWDRNLDMCTVHHQWVNIDEKLIDSTFKEFELEHRYNSRRGKYIIKYKTVSAELTIFEKVGDHMERVGWEKEYFPHLYVNYQNFPFQLIDKELKRIRFSNVDGVPVPHQNYELQKYLYPENWWREVKPRTCI